MTQAVTVSAPALREFATKILFGHGLSATHAQQVAEALIWANSRGMDTHGVSRIPTYLGFIQRGVINCQPELRWAHQAPALSILEADRSPGAVSMQMATAHVAGLCKSTGLAMAIVRATTHTGAMGYFTEQLARQGLIGLAYCSSLPMMAYHGARVPAVATAPLSIAAPAGCDQGLQQDPILLDMASSTVSMGQLHRARRFKQDLAPGLALDELGNPTTDSQRATTPLPMAGPKGSGLALMFELITSLVVQNPIVANYFSPAPDARKHQQNACILALDTFRFCDETTYREDVHRTVQALKSLPRAQEDVAIMMPGERGYRTSQACLENGIELPGPMVEELSAIAAGLALCCPWSHETD
jgi:LDH2 family malate/lactate/ureidoglycolate dehydrogenase